MNRQFRKIAFTFVFILCASQLAAQNRIPHSVFGNGVTSVTGTNYRLAGTVGQPFVGTVTGDNHVNYIGFWYEVSDLVTSVEQVKTDLIPKDFRLQQNYPNPFNPTTTIEFSVAKESELTLKIYDILGREVTTLLHDALQPGEYKVSFEAGKLPSGIYFYHIEAQTGDSSKPVFVETKKLTLLK